jgi:hypothetical protein
LFLFDRGLDLSSEGEGVGLNGEFDLFGWYPWKENMDMIGLVDLKDIDGSRKGW